MHTLLTRPAVECDLALRRLKPALHAADIAARTKGAAATGQHQRFDRLFARDRFESC